MKLILASKSPRREQVLRDAGFEFEIRAPRVDETRRAAEAAGDYVVRLAEAKARAAAALLPPSKNTSLVIGADTVVVVDGEMFGKPADSEDARAMLRRLSGRAHDVLTGVAVLPFPNGVPLTALETTGVTFAPLSDGEIENYIASGEAIDKAGAYAIQGRGGRFIERVEGCYFNVMGLPLARLYRLLRESGWTAGNL